VGDDTTFLKEGDALRDLRILEEIEKDPAVSQRVLAERLGVALGVANACVRALARRGLIKVRGDSNRTLTYHLTKTGLLHKSRLAVEWTRNTLDFYHQARQVISAKLSLLGRSGVRRVVLYGVDEQVEIAAITAAETGLEVVGVLRREGSYLGATVAGVPVGGPETFADSPLDALVLLGVDYGGPAEALRASHDGLAVIDLFAQGDDAGFAAGSSSEVAK
jgi:DNA-binding Lrp family transcriptional regulator